MLALCRGNGPGSSVFRQDAHTRLISVMSGTIAVQVSSTHISVHGASVSEDNISRIYADAPCLLV